jgi:hypothetical protein
VTAVERLGLFIWLGHTASNEKIKIKKRVEKKEEVVVYFNPLTAEPRRRTAC